MAPKRNRIIGVQVSPITVPAIVAKEINSQAMTSKMINRPMNMISADNMSFPFDLYYKFAGVVIQAIFAVFFPILIMKCAKEESRYMKLCFKSL